MIVKPTVVGYQNNNRLSKFTIVKNTKGMPKSIFEHFTCSALLDPLD